MRRSFFSSMNLNMVQPEVNLTPLIDVVFVILITFMVIVPFIQLDNISLAQGHTEQALSTDNQNIIIKVTLDGTIYLNNETVSQETLNLKLKQFYKQYPKTIPILLQDGNSTFQSYQHIKTVIQSSGFQELHVALRN